MSDALRYQIEGDASNFNRTIKAVKAEIKETTKTFEGAEIGATKFLEAASDLSGLQKELKDARSAVVDMGELLQSKQRKQSGRNVVDFEWTADHAELVHDGAAALKNGGYYPARPWTNPTLADIDEVVDGILRNGGK